MITQQPYAKVLQGTEVVLNAFCFFPFKSWADGRIWRLAVSEALARDSRTSFLGSAWLEAVLGVWSDFDTHKIVPSLRWLRLSGSTVLFLSAAVIIWMMEEFTTCVLWKTCPPSLLIAVRDWDASVTFFSFSALTATRSQQNNLASEKAARKEGRQSLTKWSFWFWEPFRLFEFSENEASE